MGRIGRSFWRVCRARTDVEVVAVNDLADPATLAHLLRYDSVRGRLRAPVSYDAQSITADGQRIAVLQRPELGTVRWGELGVDVVLESTGRFFRAEELARHLDGGARRVLVSMSAPDPDITVIAGVNEHEFDHRRHAIVSPACCTSNAVAPVLAVLHREYGVLGGMLTTVHAYDSTHSALHDSPYRDHRMGRNAAVNLVPSRIKDTTRALGRVFPELDGLIEGLAVRVPTAIGCAADLVLRLDAEVTAARVNATLAAATTGLFKGYLGYTEEPLVSSDIVGRPESCIVDSQLTTVAAGNVKLIGWYDNEWGFSHRLADVASLIGAAPDTVDPR